MQRKVQQSIAGETLLVALQQGLGYKVGCDVRVRNTFITLESAQVEAGTSSHLRRIFSEPNFRPPPPPPRPVRHRSLASQAAEAAAEGQNPCVWAMAPVAPPGWAPPHDGRRARRPLPAPPTYPAPLPPRSFPPHPPPPPLNPLGWELEETCCPICFGDFSVAKGCVITPCGHAFCRECLDASIAKFGECSMCRQPLM